MNPRALIYGLPFALLAWLVFLGCLALPVAAVWAVWVALS
jgi:hypothetical protein